MKDERNLTDYLYKLCTNKRKERKYLCVTTNLVLYINGPYEAYLFERWEESLNTILNSNWYGGKEKEVAEEIIEKIKPFYEFERT